MAEELLRLGLHDLHVELGGRIVPFAGYEMPVQFPAGVMKEHLHTRAAAGLFDVSHMGQVILRPKSSMQALALAFETLMPVDVLGLVQGRQRYGLFTNDAGGILDDLMFANRGDHLFVVVNAACKHADIAHMQAHLSAAAEVIPVTDRALLALQGPLAEAALAQLVPQVAAMRFMDVGVFGDIWVSRSGYTGEDGFEISLPQAQTEAFARRLLAQPQVLPIGLGARDSLRLEAGLCLYGHDINEQTSPVEAGLTWAIQKVRRPGGARAGGYPGATVVEKHLAGGAPSKRVGLLGLERVPVREGAAIFAAHGHQAIGHVTSGTLAPTVNQPIAMAYLPIDHTQAQHEVYAEVRGKRLPMRVSPMPFTPHRYAR
jgi:aminomethyltransferase